MELVFALITWWWF